MATQILFLSNDHLINLTGLQDSTDDSFVNDATVTVTIKTTAGVEVSGLSWPITMSYLAASNGDYQAILDKAIVLTEWIRYVAEITVVSGSRDAFIELPIQAQVRKS